MLPCWSELRTDSGGRIDMAGEWQWSLRTWVVWMPLVVAVVLALMTPELYEPDHSEISWFWLSVWSCFWASLAVGAIMRVKFPKHLFSFWVAVVLAQITLAGGSCCFQVVCYYDWQTLPESLSLLVELYADRDFLLVRSSIVAALIGGLLALWILPADQQG